MPWIIGAALLSLVFLSPAVANPTPQPTSTIKWVKCGFAADDNTLPIFCGNVSVPLDYTQEQNGQLILELFKVPAAIEKSLGSILINFGGPGSEARNILASSASYYRSAAGGLHDLIAFDPRGTGTTIPFSCYDDPATSELAGTRYRWGGTSSAALKEIWEYKKKDGEACKAKLGATTGTLVGTAFTARDYIEVAKALGRDGLLRFWGLSYGTVIGATIAAMFPQNVSRMILDGVVNPHEYYHGYDIEAMTDTDKALRRFLDECIASPKTCSLARQHTSGENLEAKVYDLFENLKHDQMNYSSTKAHVFEALYQPRGWTELATWLNNLMAGKTTAIIESRAPALAKPALFAEAMIGIRCGDKTVRDNRLDAMRPAYDAAVKKSRLAGDGQAGMFASCAQWPMEAKGRYNGPFKAKATDLPPLLIIGSPYDPITPLASALNISSGFAGSVVLKHQGYGHTSQAHKSACTDGWIKKYFEDGELPAADDECEPDLKPFELAPANNAAALPPQLRRRHFGDIM